MSTTGWIDQNNGQKICSQFGQSIFKMILTDSCVQQITSDLKPFIEMKHEGIVYLLGRTDGQVSLAIVSFCPEAETTFGSFYVNPLAMIPCIQLAEDLGLQIVGQVHTHPHEAFHSEGDEEGANIRYAGFTSLVIPDYGKHLPSLEDSACFMWLDDQGWLELTSDNLIVVSGA